jgi:hypothetical protein
MFQEIPNEPGGGGPSSVSDPVPLQFNPFHILTVYSSITYWLVPYLRA